MAEREIIHTGRPGKPKGYPKSGGRQKGIPTKAQAALERLLECDATKKQRLGTALAAEGITPLEFCLTVMRDVKFCWTDRQWAASLAMGYCHAKLTAVDHSGTIDHRHESILDYLDKPTSIQVSSHAVLGAVQADDPPVH